MVISKFFVCFVIFSFLGWVYETIYCTVKSHHWDNRGFLFGPVCPIYGSGAIIATLVFEGIERATGEVPVWWKIFLICMIGSAVLEYITSYVLEKVFHAVWWDYRDMPLNLNGRICLPASIGFGFAGIFLVNILIPTVFGIVEMANPLVVEGLSLVLMIFFAADLALTISGLTEIVNKMLELEADFNAKMEKSYQIIEGKRQLVTAKMGEYERLTSDKIKEYTRTMNHVQQHTLRNIKRITVKSSSFILEKFKDAIKRKTGSEPQEDRKKEEQT